MRADVLAWLAGQPTAKRPSKETLNHPGLVALASGRDVAEDTPRAFLEAYRALGIDLLNVVPETNAPPPARPGEVLSREGGRVQETYLGVFNASSRIRFPYADLETFWEADPMRISYEDLDLPGAQYHMPCTREAIERKEALAGDIGLYYYQLYTTLFMWGVEALGWEVFLLAVGSDPERFDRHFLEPMFEKTRKIVTRLASLDSPWVFCHDDIAAATGPVVHPDWYRTYIFPRYAELWRIPHAHGKRVFFVADGNLDWALTDLRETGVDGLMFESPSTNLDAVIDVWGDRFLIGGVEAGVLARGTPTDVRRHVEEVDRRMTGVQGFAMSCAGGLVGNMPLENLEAYVDARVETGFTPPGWRHHAAKRHPRGGKIQ